MGALVTDLGLDEYGTRGNAHGYGLVYPPGTSEFDGSRASRPAGDGDASASATTARLLMGLDMRSERTTVGDSCVHATTNSDEVPEGVRMLLFAMQRHVGSNVSLAHGTLGLGLFVRSIFAAGLDETELALLRHQECAMGVDVYR